jgi:HAD superfamily hydrolase (TIGR01549 family)
VLFDLDGTLYETSWLLKLRVTAMLLGDIAILRHVQEARERVRGRDFEGPDGLRQAFHEELGRRAGLGPSEAGDWYEDRFIRAFLQVLERHASARPGLVPLLEGVRSRGIKTAVLSDYGRVAERIEALRLPVTLFDELSSAEDAGSLKPSPRPFLMCAERLGLEPREMLVVGDRDDMDGEGARAAGMVFRALRGSRDWRAVVDALSGLGRD